MGIGNHSYLFVVVVTVGGNTGIWIFQITQAITMVGGPAGYL